jgi:uncharacterized protein YceK
MKKAICLLLVLCVLLAGCAAGGAERAAVNASGQGKDVPGISDLVTGAAWAAATVIFPVPIILDETERSQEDQM